MKLVQDVLKNQFEQLHSTYMKAHNEHSRARMELNKFSHEISRLVKWSQSGSVIYLSYGQEIYEVYKNKKKQKNQRLTYKVMKAKKVICSEYWRDMDSLRVDIVFDNLGEYK
jgi:chromosome condensin MukBEF ATPase and DNA-binding subunit MukB